MSNGREQRVYLLALTAVLISASYVARASGLPRVNAVSVLSVVWLPVMAVASLPGMLTPGLSDSTWAYVFCGLISWSIGAIWAAWHRSRIARVHPSSSAPGWTPDWNRVRRAHGALLACFLANGALEIVQLWPAIRAAGGFHALFNSVSSSAGTFKIGLVAQEAQSRAVDFSAGGVILGLLNYLTFIGLLSLFTGALLWLKGQRLRGICPIMIAAALSFITLQRTTFVLCLLLFVFGIYGFRRLLRPKAALSPPSRRLRPRRFRSTLIMILTGTLGTAVLLIPLKLRNLGTTRSTGVRSLIEYLTASIAGLNVRIGAVNGIPHPPVDVAGHSGPTTGFGAYTLTNGFTIAHRLGLPVHTVPGIYDYYVVRIGSQVFTTNTATSFYDFVLDLRYPGLVILPLILGALTSWLQLKKGAHGAAWVPMTSILLATAAWSFFVDAMTRDIRYLVMGLVGSIVIGRLGGRPNLLPKTITNEALVLEG